MKNGTKSTLWFMLILVVSAAAVAVLTLNSPSPRRGSFDHFKDLLSVHEFSEIRTNGDVIDYLTRNSVWFTTPGRLDADTFSLISSQGLKLGRKEGESSLNTLLYFYGPVAVVIFLILFVLARAAKNPLSQVKGLTESRSRKAEIQTQIKLSDVGGCSEAKELLQDVIDFLNDPERWKKLGARLPRGILLEGPPGSGKTLLARAVAGETNAHFEFVSATEFVELFVGVGAARLRDMFERIRKTTPAVVFIDELDAIGRRRGVTFGFNNEERENTLNQLLVLLDGFETFHDIVIIAATNRSDILDPALLRPGRFDRRIQLKAPHRDDRLAILAVHTGSRSISDDVSLARLADATEGMSGAQLASLVSEAALVAARRGRNETSEIAINSIDFQAALNLGRKSLNAMSQLDSLLCDSMAHRVEPDIEIQIRITLVDRSTMEGQIIWADPTFIKLESPSNRKESLAVRSHIVRIDSISLS